MNTFSGNKIRLIRKEKGLTIQELSKLVNLSPSAIGMYERGVRKPDLLLALKLSEIFDINIDYFYTDKMKQQKYNINELIKCVDVNSLNQKESSSKEVLIRADGHCELCNSFAPFIGIDGVPYLELLILEPQKSANKSNLVALCPNCHRKIEVLGLKGDITYLKNKIRKNELSGGTYEY